MDFSYLYLGYFIVNLISFPGAFNGFFILVPWVFHCQDGGGRVGGGGSSPFVVVGAWLVIIIILIVCCHSHCPSLLFVIVVQQHCPSSSFIVGGGRCLLLASGGGHFQLSVGVRLLSAFVDACCHLWVAGMGAPHRQWACLGCGLSFCGCLGVCCS